MKIKLIKIQGAAQAVQKGMFTTLNEYIRKEEISIVKSIT